MSFLAAVLLLNMEPSDAFICFANLLNKPCQLAFFRVDHPMVSAWTETNFTVHLLAYLTHQLLYVTGNIECYFPGLKILSHSFLRIRAPTKPAQWTCLTLYNCEFAGFLYCVTLLSQ